MSATRTIADLPGPRGLPLLGNALQLLPVSRAHLTIEAWSQRYGPIFQFRAGSRRWVALADQEEINAVLRDRPEGFRRLRELARSFEEIGFVGVFAAEGEAWRRQRRLVVTALNANQLHRHFDVIGLATRRLQQRLREQARLDEPLRIAQPLTSFAVDVTSALAFGHDLNTLERGEVELQRHIQLAFKMLAHRALFPFPYWRWFELPADRAMKRSVVELRSAVAGFIERARAEMRQRPQLCEEPENFLQGMLAAQQSEGRFTDDEIIGNVFTLLLAGEDTTAHTLAWTIWFLAQHKDIQERLAEEAVGLLGQERCPADHEQASSFLYGEAVIREAIRLKPVAVWESGEPLKDMTICGTLIPAGTRVTMLKRRVSLGAGGPEFEPERWLEHDERQAPDTKSFLGFGAGPRFCPGRNLAFLEAKTALAMIAADFEIELDDTSGPVSEDVSFTMIPKGLRVRLTSRAVTTPTQEDTRNDRRLGVG